MQREQGDTLCLAISHVSCDPAIGRGCFGPFKVNWKDAVNMFIHETGVVVDMYSFG